MCTMTNILIIEDHISISDLIEISLTKLSCFYTFQSVFLLIPSWVPPYVLKGLSLIIQMSVAKGYKKHEN